MFQFAPPPAIKSKLMAVSLALSAFSLNAQATLTSYTNDGVDLVYSSVSDVTWSKDANLLGTLFATQGFSNVVDAIIATTPYVTNPYFGDWYQLSSNDFSEDGSTTWYGANAYVNYLNSISYGGSNSWQLPFLDLYGGEAYSNGAAIGSELTELYVSELDYVPYYQSYNGGSSYPMFTQIAGTGFEPAGYVAPTDPFVNRSSISYWTVEGKFEGFKYEISDAVIARGDNPDAYINPETGASILVDIGSFVYVSAVTYGNVSVTPVPEPESVAMLLVGLGLMGGVARRRKQQA